MELDKSPLKIHIPGPTSPPATSDSFAQPGGKAPTIPMLSAAIERLSNRTGGTASSIINSNIMNANPATPPLRYVPERGRVDGSADLANILNNNRPEAIRGYVDPDSVRG